MRRTSSGEREDVMRSAVTVMLCLANVMRLLLGNGAVSAGMFNLSGKCGPGTARQRGRVCSVGAEMPRLCHPFSLYSPDSLFTVLQLPEAHAAVPT